MKDKKKVPIVSYLLAILSMIAVVYSMKMMAKVEKNSCDNSFIAGYCISIIGDVGEREGLFDRSWCYQNCRWTPEYDYECNYER